jgi:hypothetical protein
MTATPQAAKTTNDAMTIRAPVSSMTNSVRSGFSVQFYYTIIKIGN